MYYWHNTYAMYNVYNQYNMNSLNHVQKKGWAAPKLVTSSCFSQRLESWYLSETETCFLWLVSCLLPQASFLLAKGRAQGWQEEGRGSKAKGRQIREGKEKA